MWRLSCEGREAARSATEFTGYKPKSSLGFCFPSKKLTFSQNTPHCEKAVETSLFTATHWGSNYFCWGKPYFLRLKLHSLPQRGDGELWVIFSSIRVVNLSMATEVKVGFHHLRRMCDFKLIHLNKYITPNRDISNNVAIGYFSNK